MCMKKKRTRASVAQSQQLKMLRVWLCSGVQIKRSDAQARACCDHRARSRSASDVLLSPVRRLHPSTLQNQEPHLDCPLSPQQSLLFFTLLHGQRLRRRVERVFGRDLGRVDGDAADVDLHAAGAVAADLVVKHARGAAVL